MNHREGFFQGLQELTLYYQGWLPVGDPKAILLIVHGLAEHGGRYKNVVDHFVPQGYAAYVPDHRGHGRSQGRRTFVRQFVDYADDLKTFFDQVRGWHPERPIFVVGHSMGGTIALTFALRHQEHLSGLVLSGAGVAAGESIPTALTALVKLISSLRPQSGVITLDNAALSRDPQTVAAHDNDPLVYRGRVTARLGAELLKTIQALPTQVSQLRLPVLLMHGGADRLADPQGSRWLYEEIGATDKTLHVFEGYYHEIFNELGREKVLTKMESWLEARLSPGR